MFQLIFKVVGQYANDASSAVGVVVVAAGSSGGGGGIGSGRGIAWDDSPLTESSFFTFIEKA